MRPAGPATRSATSQEQLDGPTPAHPPPAHRRTPRHDCDCGCPCPKPAASQAGKPADTRPPAAPTFTPCTGQSPCTNRDRPNPPTRAPGTRHPAPGTRHPAPGTTLPAVAAYQRNAHVSRHLYTRRTSARARFPADRWTGGPVDRRPGGSAARRIAVYRPRPPVLTHPDTRAPATPSPVAACQPIPACQPTPRTPATARDRPRPPATRACLLEKLWAPPLTVGRVLGIGPGKDPKRVCQTSRAEVRGSMAL